MLFKPSIPLLIFFIYFFHQLLRDRCRKKKELRRNLQTVFIRSHKESWRKTILVCYVGSQVKKDFKVEGEINYLICGFMSIG